MPDKRICPFCGSELGPDSVCCPMCGAAPNEEPPAMPQRFAEEKPADRNVLTQNYALKLLRQRRVLVFILILLLAALAAAGFIIQKTVAHDKAVTGEYERMSEEVASLESEKAAVEEEKAALEAEVESKLSDADETFEDLTAENEILAEIDSFLTEYGTDYNRFSDYFAEKSVVFVREGETAALNVTFNHRDEILYWELEKEDIVEPQWGENWNAVTCELKLTGLHAGTSMLRFGSSYSEDTFYILCVVLPAE